MSYYNYHAKVAQKIKSGELTSYYFDSDYKNIGYALVLCFGLKKYPIREEKFSQYFELIGKYYKTQKNGLLFETIFLKM